MNPWRCYSLRGFSGLSPPLAMTNCGTQASISLEGMSRAEFHALVTETESHRLRVAVSDPSGIKMISPKWDGLVQLPLANSSLGAITHLIKTSHTACSRMWPQVSPRQPASIDTLWSGRFLGTCLPWKNAAVPVQPLVAGSSAGMANVMGEANLGSRMLG